MIAAQTVAFVVDPGSASEIRSATVAANIQTSQVPGAANTLRGSPVVVRGQIQARNPQAALVQGVWENTSNGGSASVDGGEFVWGMSATASQMQSLISGNPSAVYIGTTMGTTNGNEGTVRLDINFGNATWSGNFNADLDFEASGVVIGSGFVSNANGFSTNIASGEVKGGIRQCRQQRHRWF